MKNRKILCLLLSLSVFFANLNAENTDYFKVDLKCTDAILLTTGIAGYGSTEIVKHVVDFPVYNGTTLDKSTVNGFDQLFMNDYDKTLDTVADVTLYTSLALPALVYTIQGFTGNMEWSSVLDAAIMYTEAVTLANAVKQYTKFAVKRARPYMYYESKDPKGIAKEDWQFSFFSGHTCNAFLAAGFLTYTFANYYPESNWTLPVAITSYTLAVATGTLRMLSGNHFATDVLTGAAVGTLFGIGIPAIHHLMAVTGTDNIKTKVANKDVSFQTSPVGFNCKIEF